MKKLLVPIIVVILIVGGGGLLFKYYNGPKITDGVICKSVDKDGKPINRTAVFSPKDTIYFSAKGKKFLAKKATVIWYKDKIARANRLKVDNNIAISGAGYFCDKLSVPEGLKPGSYAVTIYAAGNDVVETFGKFDVNK